MAERRLTSAVCNHRNRLVEFDYHDGIYWVAKGYELLARLLGISCDSGRIGFDSPTAHLYIRKLAEGRIRVIIRKGAVVTFASRGKQPQEEPTTKINLASLPPRFLIDTRELERLSRLASVSPAFGRILGDLRSSLELGHELPIPHVYQVASDMYEVDCELTALRGSTVQALALMAFQAGMPLTCAIVPPKPRRKRVEQKIRVLTTRHEPIQYGQLSLPI